MGQIVKQKRGDGWMDYHRLLHLTSVSTPTPTRTQKYKH